MYEIRHRDSGALQEPWCLVDIQVLEAPPIPALAQLDCFSLLFSVKDGLPQGHYEIRLAGDAEAEAQSLFCTPGITANAEPAMHSVVN